MVKNDVPVAQAG